MSKETPVTEFLALVTEEWVAYGSEGVSFRVDIQEIARAHGAKADIQVQADSAVLTVYEGNKLQTVALAARQQITRLDRITRLRAVIGRAKDPEADLTELAQELIAITKSLSPYPEWAKALGIVLFTIGFSVNVQAVWQQVGFAALTGVIVALIVVLGDRIQRVSMLTPLVAAVSVSIVVLLLFNRFDVEGGAILLMVPALFFFIPGDILSTAMYEMADGRISTGSVQFVYSIFLLLLLYLGVVIGVALTATPTSELFAEVLPAEFPAIVGWLGWVLFAFGFMLAFAAPMKFYGWVLLITLLAFGVQQLGTILFGEVLGAFLAAAAMIVVAALISRNPARPPVVVLALSGFFVLTVGALGLEGLTALISGDPVAGFTDLLSMLTIGMAIALGLLTGSVVVHRSTA